MREEKEVLDYESVDELDIVDLSDNEATCVAGGPQEENIPRPR